jgi:hypothetical protein
MRPGASLLTGAALLLIASFAWALNPVEENALWEIPRGGETVQRGGEFHAVDEAGVSTPACVRALGDRYGGAWFYQVNTATGTCHHIYGGGIDLALLPAGPAEAEMLARTFVSANPSIFPVGNGALEVMSVTCAAGKWSVIFRQTYEGLRVYGGRAHVVFTQDGKLFEMGSDVYPGIDLSTVSAITASEALDTARYDIGFEEGSDRVEYSELLILPVFTEKTAVGYRLVYRFDLRVRDPFGLWATYVDAATGEIVWRENHVRFADYTGRSEGGVEWDAYCDGDTPACPLANMRVDIGGLGTAYTDEQGGFAVSGPGGPRTIAAEFRGPWVDVDRYGGADAGHSGNVTDGVPYIISWDDSNSLDSERDVFAYVNRDHDWMKELDPAFTGLDYQMTARVERTDLYCPGNAWWDGNSINLCYSASGYGNTGCMGDVVYHEYGHAITALLYGAYGPPDDVHEANSDVAANYLTGRSIIARGYYLDDCSSGIRDSDNAMQWPCSGDDHYCGQVLAGFYWDSWHLLSAAYSEAVADSVAFTTWHYGRKLGLPQSQPDQVYWTFVADDDDGNMANGTPHYAEFSTAARNHGFTCPEVDSSVFIVHEPLDDSSHPGAPSAVFAEITSIGGNVVADSCLVVYRTNGGNFSVVGMSATASPGTYVAYIPARPACSRVEYYISAKDDRGQAASAPPGAPAATYTFLVGYDVIFEDDFEGEHGWTAGASGDDATTGRWERCDPEGTGAQAEDDHTPASGVTAYITQCAAGSGDGSYDVDGGRTTLLSPVFDLRGLDRADLRYYRWYSNDTGGGPETDDWVVEITDDGWETWSALENTGSSDRSWSRKDFNLGDYVDLTDRVQMRFIASDYSPASLVEAGVDDFLLMGCGEPADTVPPAVTLLDPNGGEEIAGCGGDTYPVRWTASDDVGVAATSILLSMDGGSTYPDTLVSGALDSVWVWAVPDTNAPFCRLKVVCLDAASNMGADESDDDFEIRSEAGVPGLSDRPREVVLYENRPSPFAGATRIEFGVPAAQHVTLSVYSVDGRLVTVVADRVFPAGYHSIIWRGRGPAGRPVADGVYFCRLATVAKALTVKVLVLR